MDYQNLLKYYLTSEEWYFRIEDLWQEEHKLSISGNMGQRSYLVSDVFLQHEAKLKAAGGTYTDVHLTETEFLRYFSNSLSESQRFSVIFSIWWELRPWQIQLIGSNAHAKDCLQWLNYFLCCREVSPESISPDSIKDFHYQGKYHKIEYYTDTLGVVRWHFKTT